MSKTDLLPDTHRAEALHALPIWITAPLPAAPHLPEPHRAVAAARAAWLAHRAPAPAGEAADASVAVWSASGAALRRGLLETAFLPRLTRAAIAQVSAAPGFAQYLDRLADEGEVVQRDGGWPPAARYTPRFRAFLQSMARATLEPDALADLLYRTNTAMESELESLQPARGAAPRVHIRALGRFHILRDGTPLPRHRKAPGKPLMLIKALVALGPASVPSHTLADLLWPDAEGDSADARLTTTLHRARALLGVPEAVLKDAGELALDRQLVACDVFEFHDLLQRLETQQDTTEAVRAQLLAAYPAPLLPACTGEAWLQPCRERLAAKFAAAVARLGRRLDAGGRHGEAQTLYLEALAREPMAECLRRLL